MPNQKAENIKNKEQKDKTFNKESLLNLNQENSEIVSFFKKSQEENVKLTDKILSLEKAQDIIFEQFRDLELQRIDLEKQQKKLEEDSEKFRSRTIDLFGKLVDLKKAKKTISLQNEKLETQQKEIEIHQTLLEKSNEKFRERTIELFGKMIDLKKAKKTISLQKEEIENHREQLTALNASKDKFFSIIAHDLRNPIAGFLNLTEILTNNFDVFSENESKEFIEVMNEASKQLYNLLENLLQWSRAQTGGITYEPKFISIKKMVDETIDALMINIENKSIKISLNLDEKAIVFVDENMITTVIRNLLSNAIKFSHRNEIISIRCTSKEEFVELSVIDNGIGIKKEDREKLFRIDQHLTTPGTSEEKGTGLGLILCKEFVEKNRGKIWVESDLNKGSEFTFTLPKK
ncbi:MAG TPA: hypothetical protein DCG75_06495 [Bacteroidales bacterium]|nr:hypothetical protein [Bacteroidales bacterium]